MTAFVCFLSPRLQAFFLEDVLVQTDYLKEIGADAGGGGGGGGGGGLLGGTGLEGLEEAEGEESFKCALCGKAGFRCVLCASK